jgi:hypothetical protein
MAVACQQSLGVLITMVTYLKVWNDPVIIPQRLRVFVPEKGKGLFSGLESCIGVVEVGGVSVTPSKVNRTFSCEVKQTNITHQP